MGGHDGGRGRRSRQSEGRGYLLLFSALLVCGWAAAAIVALVSWTPLRSAAGLLLVGVIPGALASYAALPPASRIDGRLRGVLAVSLSVTIAIFVGLALALISDHISKLAVAVCLGAALTAAAAVAFARDDGSTALWLPARPAISPVAAVVAGLLAVLAVTSVVVALNVDSLPTRFTAVSLTRAKGGVRLSIQSQEDRSLRYRYVLSDGAGKRLDSGAIRIDAGAEGNVLVPVGRGVRLVRAELFRGGSPTPYRSVELRRRAGAEITSATAP